MAKKKIVKLTKIHIPQKQQKVFDSGRTWRLPTTVPGLDRVETGQAVETGSSRGKHGRLTKTLREGKRGK